MHWCRWMTRMCRTRSGAIHQSSTWGAAARMGVEAAMVPWVLDPRIRRPLWSTESKRRARTCTRCKRWHTPSQSPASHTGCNHAPCRSRCSRAPRTYTGCTKAGSRRGLTGPSRSPCASTAARRAVCVMTCRSAPRGGCVGSSVEVCLTFACKHTNVTRTPAANRRLCSSQPPASLHASP